MAGAHFADGFQFIFRETDPGRIVRRGVDQSAEFTGFQEAFQLGGQFRPPVLIDVKALERQTQDLGLAFVDRKTRIDEKDMVLTFFAAPGHHHGQVGSLHGAHRGQAPGRLDLHIHVIANEPRNLGFQFGDAVKRRVGRANPFSQGRAFSLHGNGGGSEPRNSHLHPDKRALPTSPR